MKTTITGNITANATVKTLENGHTVVNFDIAVNDSYRKKGATETTKVTTFVQCAYWNRNAIAPYLLKGTLVEVTGQVGARAYMSNDGTPKAALTITVLGIKLHGKRAKAGGATTAHATAPAKVTEPVDDLPF